MTFGKLDTPSSFGARLDMLAAKAVPKSWYIIRDNDGTDYLVWNWEEQDWAWDVDGDYRGCGWEYRSKSAAVARAKTLATKTFPGFTVENVRVVDEDALYKYLDRDPPNW